MKTEKRSDSAVTLTAFTPAEDGLQPSAGIRNYSFNSTSVENLAPRVPSVTGDHGDHGNHTCRVSLNDLRDHKLNNFNSKDRDDYRKTEEGLQRSATIDNGSDRLNSTKWAMNGGDGRWPRRRSVTAMGAAAGGCGAADGGGGQRLSPGGALRAAASTVAGAVADRTARCCTRKMLLKRVPILGWLPQYNKDHAIADLVAGITVGLTVIPQAIAYASVAGLPPQYGLYSSFMGCFIYAIFGSCKVSPVGPTAIAAILTRENLHDLPPEFAVVLCFLSGCVELLMGILQLGFLIDFISGPVSAGFTSAAAIIIATSQVKDVLGLEYSGSKFLQVWEQLFAHIHETRLWDAVLGISCMAVLLILRKVKDIPVGPADKQEKSRIQRLASHFLWFVSTGRNILVVVFCGALAAMLEAHGAHPFKLTGNVKGGLPPFEPPPTSVLVGNSTYNFLDITSSLGSALLVVPLLSILENIALAKAFSDGAPLDATQEMLSIGLCNIVSSFVSSMPITGSLSRGAVNQASGVATPFGSIYTGTLVILALQFFTPYFYYIPKASLAAVIIAAVVFMVEFHVVKPMWRTNKVDLIPAGATFLSCLFIRLEIGIVIGIGINVLFLLYASARPSVTVQRATSGSGQEYLLITPDRSLSFPSVEYVRNIVSKVGMKQGSSSIPVVIDSRHIHGADFTAAKGVKSLIEDFVKRSQPLLFYNLKPSVVEVFQGVRPGDFRYCHSETELNELLREHSKKRPLETKAPGTPKKNPQQS